MCVCYSTRYHHVENAFEKQPRAACFLMLSLCRGPGGRDFEKRFRSYLESGPFFRSAVQIAKTCLLDDCYAKRCVGGASAVQVITKS